MNRDKNRMKNNKLRMIMRKKKINHKNEYKKIKMKRQKNGGKVQKSTKIWKLLLWKKIRLET